MVCVRAISYVVGSVGIGCCVMLCSLLQKSVDVSIVYEDADIIHVSGCSCVGCSAVELCMCLCDVVGLVSKAAENQLDLPKRFNLSKY